MLLNLKVKCERCGNKNDKNFILVPKEEEVMDGKYFAPNKFSIICKICGKIHNLVLKLE
jgi:hypothetical protein